MFRIHIDSREVESDYTLTILASNDPIYDIKADPQLVALDQSNMDEDADNGTLTYKTEMDKSTTFVEIKVLDENDNAPKFEKALYYAGMFHFHLVVLNIDGSGEIHFLTKVNMPQSAFCVI